MKRTITLVALVLATSSAFATGKPDFPNGHDNRPEKPVKPSSSPRQDQGQAQGQAQLQGQAQGQGQAQLSSNRNTAGAAAQANNSQGNTQAITVNEAAIPATTYQEIRQNDYTVRTPAAIVAPNVYPTAPCLGSWSAGVSGVFGNLAGVSGGATVQDDDCGYRETSRSFSSLGLIGDAIAALCESKYAKNTPSCKKLASGGAVEPSPVVTPVAKSEPVCKTEIDGRGIRTTICN